MRSVLAWRQVELRGLKSGAAHQTGNAPRNFFTNFRNKHRHRFSRSRGRRYFSADLSVFPAHFPKSLFGHPKREACFSNRRQSSPLDSRSVRLTLSSATMSQGSRAISNLVCWGRHQLQLVAAPCFRLFQIVSLFLWSLFSLIRSVSGQQKTLLPLGEQGP